MHSAERLAEHLGALKATDIPSSVRDRAAVCLLDLLGAAASGWSSTSARAIREVALTTLSGGRSPVWFAGRTGTAAAAALANSAAASALDVDDGHYEAGGHPGASIIPAVLAAAQDTGADGARILTAIVIGYEAALRIAAARNLATLDTFSTGRWCAFGAAAAVGWLRGLEPRRIAEALAIAGLQVPYLAAIGYSTHKSHGVKEALPWSTLTGVVAVDLAERGLTGPLDLFDYPAVFDAARIVNGWPHGYAIERVYFKPYACCRYIHAAIDALIEIMAAEKLAPRDISRVRVYTFERGLRFHNPRPSTLEGVQFSTPYCLAVAAFRGAEAFLPLAEDVIGRPELLEFAARVQLCVDPALEARFPAQVPARLVLETGRGSFEKHVEDPLGDPANPMPPERLKAKFDRLTRGLWAASAGRETASRALEIEGTGLDKLNAVLVRPLRSDDADSHPR